MVNESPKVTFKIVKYNKRRASRGVEPYHIEVYMDGEYDSILWMSPANITQNKKTFGEDSFSDERKGS